MTSSHLFLPSSGAGPSRVHVSVDQRRVTHCDWRGETSLSFFILSPGFVLILHPIFLTNFLFIVERRSILLDAFLRSLSFSFVCCATVGVTVEVAGLFREVADSGLLCIPLLSNFFVLSLYHSVVFLSCVWGCQSLSPWANAHRFS